MLSQFLRGRPKIGILFTHGLKPHFLTGASAKYTTTSSTCQAAEDLGIDTANFKVEHSKKLGDARSPRGVPSKKRFPPRKLHSRILSSQEKSTDEEIARSVSELPQDERYGQFATIIRRQQRLQTKASTTGVRKTKKKRDEKSDNGDVFGTMVNQDELQLPTDILSHARKRSTDPLTVTGEEALVDEESDDEEHIPLREFGLRGYDARWYAKQIEKLGREGKVYEAIYMLEKTMLREDRVAPTEYSFTVVIGILGRVGYTKKAFQLFNTMKKYGLIPEDPTYTALFNACANSPFREDGLKRADGLCLLIREKGIEPNFLTIKAMVKTYGKLGEIGTATSIIDRIVEAGQYKLDDEAWSHIFIACISDKETGFKHAIEIWRRMRLKLKPNAYHYNLLLRSARDCSVGDSDYANELLGRSTAEQDAFMENRLPSGFKPRKEIDINSLVVSEYKSLSKDCDIPKGFGGAESKQPVSNPEINASTGQIVKKIQRSETKAMALTQADLPEVSNQLLSLRSDNSSQGVSNVPNILNPRGVRKGAIISLGNLETPESRLSLLGGVPGVLGHMKKDNVNPDIKTFSLFLDMIPSTTKAEHDLLAVMEVGLVEPDEDFLNAIIRRRCKRYELTSALDVLSLFNKMKLVPNLMTFANLALGCKNHTSGLMLLENIKDAGFEPTVDIYGILIRRSGYNFKYMKALCLRMGRDRIEPNKNIIEVLEAKISKTGKFIVKKEKGENVPKQFLGDEMAKDFKGFMLFYKPWLLSTNVYTPPHPWTQYRNPYSNNNPETQDDDKNQS